MSAGMIFDHPNLSLGRGRNPDFDDRHAATGIFSLPNDKIIVEIMRVPTVSHAI
jgi:hypothetical protein